MRQVEQLDVAGVHGILRRAGIDFEPDRVEVRISEDHSNTLAMVDFGAARTLVVKRARYAEMAGRFGTSREASRLLQEHTDVLVPRYLPPVKSGGELPTLMYWLIPEPTLEEVWSELGTELRHRALCECGRLLRRIHRVELRSHGPLLEGRRGDRTLSAWLDQDLNGRLRAPVEASWPSRVELLDRLHGAFAAALARRPDPPAVLVHNDLFIANVLCRREPDAIRCVGVLDFEDCFAGPAEADLAKTEVLHGPLFGRAMQGPWFEHVLEGYGASPDAQLVALFRAYHLLNMGYHAAATGLEAHAAEVAEAIDRELDRWEEGSRHRRVLQ